MQQMVKCGPAGMWACSLGLIGFRVRDKVRVSIRDRIGNSNSKFIRNCGLRPNSKTIRQTKSDYEILKNSSKLCTNTIQPL